MRVAAVEESLSGRIVLMPHVNMRAMTWLSEPDANETKAMLDRLHLEKIYRSDEILVVSDATGYIGDSTRREIRHAEAMGKTIRYWKPREAVA